ncbi:MAG: acetyl-CoA C-acetyltransferase [Metallibacterium scheffleri]|jgi:acetyl-CoA C-acetyltransferase|uniref:acetyl-CoA C-acetyltransferase n=1 Tax=Metallibacterium scheffleri TaxID=993689 RepID=UPI0026EF958F|nr:acetyl-CoA C-acetyltransferase [Metallibacterium scheffleri]MCK9366639.1 acetyl-CoA C-acetyltransferase [Metallibacterium scheffleri]
MNASPRRVAILGGTRIPFCRNNTAYAEVGNFGMGVKVLGALVERMHLAGVELGEVAFGAVLKLDRDWNLAREVTLSAGLAATTPAITTARACGTSLDNAVIVANKIACGQIEAGIAGGSDTTSDVPIVFSEPLRKRLLAVNRARGTGARLRAALRGFRPRELMPAFPGVAEPRTGLSMGQHTELMARQWGIAREDQDRLALASHQKLAAAYAAGFFDDLVVPFRGLARDGFLRGDTTLDKLAALKPAFDTGSGLGTLTAGNSTGLSDGAAAALLASEPWAAQRGLPVQAYLLDAEVAAVDFVAGEGLLMAPTIAVARLLKRNGLSLQDFDYYEIHEAFAAQVLCTLRAWESATYCQKRLGLDAPLGSIDQAKLNVHGSSLAVGHPFAATGARILATLAKLLAQRGGGRGLISICTAGGMGVAAIVER